MPVVNAVGNALTGSTGTGAFVGQTSPTLITPDIGTPASGILINCRNTIVQQLRSSTAGGATTTSIIPADNTIPQNTEGVEVLDVTITPVDASNILIIQVFIPTISVASGGSYGFVGALFVDSTADAICASFGGVYAQNFNMFYRLTAGSTTARQYKFHFGASAAGTVYFNRSSSGNIFSSSAVSFLQVTEIAL